MDQSKRSMGSLNEKVHEGDIFIPYYSISGDGASIYFENKMDTANFFNKIFFSTQIKQHIENILKTFDKCNHLIDNINIKKAKEIKNTKKKK